MGISMKRALGSVWLVVMLMACSLSAQTVTERTTLPKFGKSSVKEVIAAMTTEEKVKLLVGMGMEINIPGLLSIDPEDKKIPERVPGAAVEKVNKVLTPQVKINEIQVK